MAEYVDEDEAKRKFTTACSIFIEIRRFHRYREIPDCENAKVFKILLENDCVWRSIYVFCFVGGQASRRALNMKTIDDITGDAHRSEELNVL